MFFIALDFWVHVVAEDDRVMKCSPKDFVLKLWHVKNGNPTTDPPAKVGDSMGSRALIPGLLIPASLIPASLIPAFLIPGP